MIAHFQLYKTVKCIYPQLSDDGGSLSSENILGLFLTVFLVAVWGKTSIFKIITIDLWGQSSNLHGQSYSILLILFHRWTIFKMLALKQLESGILALRGGGIVRLL